VSQGSGFIAAFLASLWSGGRAVFSVLSLLVITPVVAFYLLCDWDRVVVTIDGWTPRNSGGTYAGAIDVRTAFAYSKNTVAAQLGNEVGFATVAAMFRPSTLTTIGSPSSRPNPSAILRSIETSGGPS